MSLNVQAKKQYITDQFDIMLRVAPGLGAKIIKPLPTGTPLTVIISDAGKAHSQVKTDSGLVGYVLTRFISNKPAARDRVIVLEKQIESLREDPDKLKSQYLDLQNSYENLSKKFRNLVESKDKILTRFDKLKNNSENVVALSEKAENSAKEVEQLVLQLDDLSIENEVLKDQSEKRSWMVGGAIALFGVLFGSILVSLNRRKHY
jgi:SH3 domain protein